MLHIQTRLCSSESPAPAVRGARSEELWNAQNNTPWERDAGGCAKVAERADGIGAGRAGALRGGGGAADRVQRRGAARRVDDAVRRDAGREQRRDRRAVELRRRRVQLGRRRAAARHGGRLSELDDLLVTTVYVSSIRFGYTIETSNV